jgi:hypothetical protein
MIQKDDGIPEEILKELNVNEVEEIPTEFEVSPIVEHHQVKLPVPKRLIRDFELNFQKGNKIKLKFNGEKKELIYKIK